MTEMLINPATRCRLPELMDDPNLDGAAHARALVGLKRVNLFSRSSAGLWSAISELARELNGKPLRVLDIACGGGDVTVSIALRAKRHGLPIEVSGCDLSPFAVEQSRRFAESLHADNTQFFHFDALNDSFPTGYDVVMCSLFLHHLSDEDAVSLLRRMSAHARHLVLVNDLRRTRFGYVLAWLGCRLLSRSPIVHVDGPRSVCAAFTNHEVLEAAAAAGMDSPTITNRWPQRFLLSWRKPH